jgi:hypothetical protein
MQFTIHVVDDENDGISGIEVSVFTNYGRYEAETDSDGNAEFDLDDRVDEIEELFIDSEEYEGRTVEDGYSYTYAIRDGINRMNFTIRVYDDDGDPAEGVQVTLIGNGFLGNGVAKETTDSDGEASFSLFKTRRTWTLYIGDDLIDEDFLAEDDQTYQFRV